MAPKKIKKGGLTFKGESHYNADALIYSSPLYKNIRNIVFLGTKKEKHMSKQAVIKITGVTPIQFSRFHETEKLEGESHDAYEKRTWINKLHTDEDGYVFAPQMSLKKCIDDAAKYESIAIKGCGKKTWTQKFERGTFISDQLYLLDSKGKRLKPEDFFPVRVFASSDGRRGGSKRVIKFFPTCAEWETFATMFILEPKITKEILEEHLKIAGNFVGIGTFRPQNCGYNGRFKAEVEEFTDMK